MSKNVNLVHEDFVFVRSKKKRRKPKINIISEVPEIQDESQDIDKNSALRRIEGAKEEISTSDLFCSILASLREGLESLGNPEIKEIFCLGIGHVGERTVPRYQLALLLCLKQKLNASIFVQDPALWTIERELLNDLGCVVLDKNLEGKYEAKSDCATLFYLPHCPKQLTNNLLWCNWGLNLRNCIIIANSFSTITETLSKRQLMQNANFISNITSHTLELAVINTFKYFEVFNDTAIHMFPLNKLTLLSKDFWDNRDEPNYGTDAVEFITNNLVNIRL